MKIKVEIHNANAPVYLGNLNPGDRFYVCDRACRRMQSLGCQPQTLSYPFVFEDKPYDISWALHSRLVTLRPEGPTKGASVKYCDLEVGDYFKVLDKFYVRLPDGFFTSHGGWRAPIYNVLTQACVTFNSTEKDPFVILYPDVRTTITIDNEK